MASEPAPRTPNYGPTLTGACRRAGRWFQLTSWGNLRYYEDETKVNQIDAIPLGGCTIFVPKTKRPDYPHAFRLNLDVDSGEKHKYILSADTADESREWQQAILRFAPLPSVRSSVSGKQLNF